MRKSTLLIGLLLLTTMAIWFFIDQNTDTYSENFQARIFRDLSGHSLPYRLFVPTSHSVSETYPLIIYLHGQAGRGTDNVKQISKGNFHGSHTWIQPEMQKEYPAFVVAPQSKNGWFVSGALKNLSEDLQGVVELIDDLCNEFPIDERRLYVMGQSVGGFAVWSLVHHKSNLFAAAVPIAWGFHSRVTEAEEEIPIWTFSGEKDGSVKGTRNLVESFRQKGWDIKYTEYPDKGHVIWHQVYSDPDLQEWIFKQKRNDG